MPRPPHNLKLFLMRMKANKCSKYNAHMDGLHGHFQFLWYKLLKLILKLGNKFDALGYLGQFVGFGAYRYRCSLINTQIGGKRH